MSTPSHPRRPQQLALDPETFAPARVAKRKAPPGYAEQNEIAAEVILSDPARYPGAMAEWARAVRERKGEA